MPCIVGAVLPRASDLGRLVATLVVADSAQLGIKDKPLFIERDLIFIMRENEASVLITGYLRALPSFVNHRPIVDSLAMRKHFYNDSEPRNPSTILGSE